MTSPRHLALVGPTASGKSALALAVAEAVGDAEIVSVDSMQVYRGMDVGTAKPSPAERARVPHHLVDVIDPWEEWNVVRFRDAVRDAVADIEGRGRRAILVGGTGLYVRAVVDPLEFPGEDRALRATIEAEADEHGLAALYETLVAVDPLAASRIDPLNRRRLVRALEVVRLTGRPFSSFGPGLTEYGEPVVPVEIVGLRVDADELAARIARRLQVMRAAGLADEVRRLLADTRGLSRTARQAIGYKEIAEFVEGRTSEGEAFETAEVRTRSFARRQRKWFERDPRIRWIDASPENPADALPAVLEVWSPCRASI
ncbi:MAG TPA: tRNA (adenosine(37)-N6)-dimethylallyltransferase MiaA [Acidimicrobiia bacterium]|nr:tRNA (adenosine(37)-N6)-dimethylallyltransferase MiaA [Acidimicrobiia bacterium]